MEPLTHIITLPVPIYSAGDRAFEGLLVDRIKRKYTVDSKDFRKKVQEIRSSSVVSREIFRLEDLPEEDRNKFISMCEAYEAAKAKEKEVVNRSCTVHVVKRAEDILRPTTRQELSLFQQNVLAWELFKATPPPPEAPLQGPLHQGRQSHAPLLAPPPAPPPLPLQSTHFQASLQLTQDDVQSFMSDEEGEISEHADEAMLTELLKDIGSGV